MRYGQNRRWIGASARCGKGALGRLVAEIGGWLAALVIAAVVPAVAQTADFGASATAPKKGGEAARLESPSLILCAPASEARLDIKIHNRAALQANAYVRIQGLPPKVALSDGYAIAPGAWAVSIASLSGLRLVVPAGVSGKNDVSISLVTIDGGVSTTSRTTVVIAAAAIAQRSRDGASGLGAPVPAERSEATVGVAVAPVPPQPPPVEAAPRKSPPAPPASPPAPPRLATLPPPAPAAPAKGAQGRPGPSLSVEARGRAEGFLKRGRLLFGEGNVALARLFFQRAADEGLAEGALAMGETFDATELQRNGVIGVQPDPDEARRWYEEARVLGVDQLGATLRVGEIATQRLERLGRAP